MHHLYVVVKAMPEKEICTATYFDRLQELSQSKLSLFLILKVIVCKE